MDALFTAASDLGWIIALGVPFAALWWGTRWIPKRWARIYARFVITPALWYALAVPLHDKVTGSAEEGNWRCIVCGAVEHRWVFRGWTLRREPRVGVEEIPDTRAFEAWYSQEIGASHEHDWNPIGCHRYPVWNGVGCYISTGQPYFAAIPRLPDPVIARSMVERALRATPEDRRRMIYDVARDWPEDLFNAIAGGAEMSRDEFDRSYASWLVRHPAWR